MKYILKAVEETQGTVNSISKRKNMKLYHKLEMQAWGGVRGSMNIRN